MSNTDAAAWSPTSGGPLGRSRKRSEDPRLVTGKGRYVADFVTADTLHAQFVRSPLPHGRIVDIEIEEAAAMPGVRAVVTASDLLVNDLAAPMGITREDVSRPILARERVRYVGEPVALVVADTAARAEDAAQMVWVEIDELPVAMADSPAAADAAPRLFEGSNLIAHEITEPLNRVDEVLPVRAQVEVHNQRVAAVAIEGLAILCRPDDGGRLTVYCSHQAPHRLKGQLAATLDMDSESVRVIVPDVGGAFGLKGMYFTEYAAVAATARSLGTPVVWLERRREHLTAGKHGRGQTHRVTLEGDTTGRIRRADIAICADVGAYPQGGALIPMLSRFVASGLYDIEEVTVDMSIVVSNRAPTGSYRGAGRPEAAYAIERALDEFAVAAGLDPAEVRRRNFIRADQLPYRTTTGALYDSGDYEAALDMALELVDVEAVRREQQERRAAGRNPVGFGLGAFVERSGGAKGSGEFGDVEMDPAGRLIVRTGSTDSGQGHKTVWAQTLADVFAVDPTTIEVRAGDTDEVDDGVGTYASRSAQIGAAAAYRMGVQVRELARQTAADMLEASPADLVIEDGGFHVAGVPGSRLSFAEIAEGAAARGRSLRASEMFAPDNQAFPYGVHAAVVEVDLETGLVDVRTLVSVDDCGNVLNPMIVEGQIHGSLIQGLGQALLENVVYDEYGTLLSGTMVDYLIPNAVGLPEVRAGRLVSPAPNNPLGVKGTGEAGCIGAPPAIVNAALDALRPYGVTDLQMPLTPARVWAALRSAQAAPKS